MKKLLTLLAIVLCLTAIAGIALAIDLPQDHSVVAWGEVDSITSIMGHWVDWYEVVVPATCTTQGVAHYHCTDDGGKDTLHIVYIAAGHQWSSKSGVYDWGAIIKEATCYEEGLAIDVCLVCKQTNPDVTRVIQKTAHKYDPTTRESNPYINPKNNEKYIGYFILKAGETDFSKHFVVCTAPTCADSDWPDSQIGEGDGWRVCTNPGCGYVDKSVKVSLRRLPHTWSDWKIHREATCVKKGYATRICAGCGKLEELTEDTDKTSYQKHVAIKNPNWDGTMGPIKLTMEGKKGGCEFEPYAPESWLTGCYSKQIVYVCPYCKCDVKVTPGTTHTKVIDSGSLVSHIYKDTPQPFATSAPSSYQFFESTQKQRLAFAKDNKLSVKPDCLYEGYEVYICKYWDDEHDSCTWDDSRFKIVPIPALGHNLTEWKLIDTYEKAGKTIYVFGRQCLNCGTMETKATFNPEGTGGSIVDSIKLSKSKLKLKVGETYQLSVKMLPANDELATVSWKSSKKSVASVSSDGFVTAKKKGTATITVTVKSKFGGTFTAKCKVTVK